MAAQGERGRKRQGEEETTWERQKAERRRMCSPYVTNNYAAINARMKQRACLWVCDSHAKGHGGDHTSQGGDNWAYQKLEKYVLASSRGKMAKIQKWVFFFFYQNDKNKK